MQERKGLMMLSVRRIIASRKSVSRILLRKLNKLLLAAKMEDLSKMCGTLFEGVVEDIV